MSSTKIVHNKNHLLENVDVNGNNIDGIFQLNLNGLTAMSGHNHSQSEPVIPHNTIAPGHLNVNAITNSEFSYEKVEEIANWLLARVETRPKIAIVCGSGLGGLGDRLVNTTVFPYDTIPNFPHSTVQGHKGNLIFGQLNNVDVVCMQGRFHAYEGYSNALCTLPIKVFKLLGIKSLILTCAAGGVKDHLQVGDIMLIKDHIAPILWNLQHPLVGHNDDRFGPRFPAANKIYKKKLRDTFKEVSKDLNIETKEGVYVSFGGPNYETVSELLLMAKLGGDAVGMSTAHEALVAVYCGLDVLALALITNKSILDYDSEEIPNHEEVMETAKQKAKDIETLVIEYVTRVHAQLEQ